MIVLPEIAPRMPDSSRFQGLRMTFDEFLNWDEGVYAEWVNGEIMLINTPGRDHQEISAFLTTLMAAYSATTKAGTVLAAPFLVSLPNAARHPDVMFIAKENLARLTPQYLDGAPDIAVEITSRTTRTTDDELKFREYEAAGVREYWQIDPKKRETKFYRRDDHGKLQRIALHDETFVSDALPGFQLKPEWLWDNPLARVAEVLHSIGAV